MSIIESILLGIVQGITEFLPVSSSGHLAILQNIFHVETNGSMLFDIMLHIGTLVAVFVVYHKDIWNMIKEAIFMAVDICSNLKTFFLNISSPNTFAKKVFPTPDGPTNKYDKHSFVLF